MSALSVDRNLQKAKNLAKKGQTDEAYQLYCAVLEKHPSNKRAIEGLKRLQQAGPDNEQINSLVALYKRGQLQQALQLGAELAQRFPTSFLIFNILGVICFSLERFEDAVASYNKALQLKPDFSEAHNNLGNALKSLGRYEEAIACYNNALQIKPDDTEVHNNLGTTFIQLGRYKEAIARFTKVLQIKPGDMQACNNLLEQYERDNNLPALKDALENAKETLPEDDSNLLYHLGQLASREKRLEDARTYLEKVSSSKLSPKFYYSHAELLGKTYDKLNMHDKAFEQFELMNNRASQSISAQKVDAQRYYNSLVQLSDSWAAAPSPAWSSEVTSSNEGCRLAFLIGFPRSGTTLLDTILRSHPKVTVVEEMLMVQHMMAHLGVLGTYEETINLDPGQLAELRGAYYKELNKHLDTTGYDLVIDKMPLNINHVGLIHRVFPEARFILALRHPCDCVLSCFMQYFKLTNAMANFLDLGQAAKYYDAVMRLWKIYNEHLNLPVGVVKYEDLVLDLKGNAEPLLDFLGLEWHENMENYQKTALARGRIKTPSYNQVTQELYTQASGRWENYRKQMEPVLPLLEPWARHFGY